MLKIFVHDASPRCKEWSSRSGSSCWKSYAKSWNAFERNFFTLGPIEIALLGIVNLMGSAP
jgi:hypothetical protein